MHSEHRKRMKERFVNCGFNAFSDFEKLEFLLYYALPRIDTNPIAHELISTFGSFSAVFDAKYDDLCKVNGVSEHTASLIKMIPQIARAYMLDIEREKTHLCDMHSAGSYASSLFFGLENEEFHAIFLDNSLAILGTAKLSEGKTKEAIADTRNLVSKALSFNASYVILAHNHPGGIAIPSSDDLNVTSVCRVALSQISVSLLEHIIVAGENYIGIINKSTDRDENLFLHINC